MKLTDAETVAISDESSDAGTMKSRGAELRCVVSVRVLQVCLSQQDNDGDIKHLRHQHTDCGTSHQVTAQQQDNTNISSSRCFYREKREERL